MAGLAMLIVLYNHTCPADAREDPPWLARHSLFCSQQQSRSQVTRHEFVRAWRCAHCHTSTPNQQMTLGLLRATSLSRQPTPSRLTFTYYGSLQPPSPIYPSPNLTEQSGEYLETCCSHDALLRTACARICTICRLICLSRLAA